MATDNHAEISSFSWSRHDGRTFGDQTILDRDLNLRIHTSFQRHPVTNAWTLRVSAKPINENGIVQPVSLAFYAAAGPDEADPQVMTSEEDAQQWGTLHLAKDTQVSEHGIVGDVVINGEAQSVGGSYRVIVKEPALGAMDRLTVSGLSSDGGHFSERGLGSRSLLRARADKREEETLPVDAFHVASIRGDARLAWEIESSLKRLLRGSEVGNQEPGGQIYFLGDTVDSSGPGMLVQRILQPPFRMEAVFVHTKDVKEAEARKMEKDMTGAALDRLLERSRDNFDQRFEHVFRLKEKGLSDGEIEFAKAALSNVLGGIGFFHGSSVAQKKGASESGRAENLEFLKPISLLTATPSRAQFPRGFLWDEGFHQLIVQRWDPELSRRCMRSWMSAMQDSGWIPREQVLGTEARNRFPHHIQHLLIQHPKVANPPTILMPLRFLASAIGSETDRGRNMSSSSQQSSDTEADTTNGDSPHKFSKDVLVKAKKYYAWLKMTQSGDKEYSFRWRGRSSDVVSPDGYPLTLASGLDDYPRVETPSLYERHVDLHSWMAWASGVLANLSEKAGEDPSPFLEEHRQLRSSLIDLHGSSDLHSMKRDDLLLCDYDGDEKVCHEGYATILPLILGLLDPADARVGAILQALEDPKLLRARAGIRSLSKDDRWHRKGDDYWTGSVWMPFNFLTLAALKARYSVEDGPYKERAETVFNGLRKSILDNAFRVFSETGQLWENYSPDDDGAGKSGRQFTGWSALVLLMYADMFDEVT